MSKASACSSPLSTSSMSPPKENRKGQLPGDNIIRPDVRRRTPNGGRTCYNGRTCGLLHVSVPLSHTLKHYTMDNSRRFMMKACDHFLDLDITSYLHLSMNLVIGKSNWRSHTIYLRTERTLLFTKLLALFDNGSHLFHNHVFYDENKRVSDLRPAHSTSATAFLVHV